ncbi:hypothetical protein K435DRAFT_857114 [Dendrothele bispora CBS 962.96]|uniref:Uncharacterized protein n=1 Tax=Dendrothele bispora (strain CBS 962.96) TaxID=1314807 RepID=A0A4S8M6S5_DENBC|nr:hypothetical protein K435DRAFT_857114 [Dendrothele bispora CBS 962.96]
MSLPIIGINDNIAAMSKSTSQSQQPTAHADGLSFLKKNFKGILQNKDVSGTDSSQSQQPPSESIQSSSETGSNTPPPVQSNEQQQQPDIVVDPTYAVSADIQGIDTNPLELTRYWPRDPGGPILTSPFEFTGKRAPNAHVLWSANTTGIISST